VTVRPDAPDSLGGTVWVRAAIDTCGRVVGASVERTDLPPAFGEAALVAARRWRFHPANCEPTWMRRRTSERMAGEIILPFRFED
jgi:TonB family protein